jgi:hypothetical protein
MARRPRYWSLTSGHRHLRQVAGHLEENRQRCLANPSTLRAAPPSRITSPQQAHRGGRASRALPRMPGSGSARAPSEVTISAHGVACLYVGDRFPRVREHQPGARADILGDARFSVTGPEIPRRNEGSGAGRDPSRPAFWLPFQDNTTHNHTPQWTQQVATMTPMGMCIATSGNCMQ